MKLAAMLVLAVGCADSQSALVTSSPQVELTANPGGVANRPRFELTLTTWNHLAALGDATEAGQIEVTVDGEALAIEPNATGYFGDHDRYTATFVLPEQALARVAPADTSSSIVTVADPQTTWSVRIADLFTNDLAPDGAMLAQQPNTLAWPSAATSEPWSSIDFACAAVEGRTTACHSAEVKDPGVDITQELVTVDLPAQPGDRFVIWAQRFDHPVASGDGPIFFASILDQVAGTFQ